MPHSLARGTSTQGDPGRRSCSVSIWGADCRTTEPILRAAFRKREVARIIAEYATPSEATPTEGTLINTTPPEATHIDVTPPEATHIDTTPPEATHINATPPEETHVDPTPLEETHIDATPPEATPTEPTDTDTEGHADISRQVKTADKRDKGVQTFFKGVRTVMKGLVPTSVKRIQTMARHTTSFTTTASQYHMDDCSHQPQKLPPGVSTLRFSSTPAKTRVDPVPFPSPGLNSTLMSDIMDDIDPGYHPDGSDPDYHPDESYVSDDADPDLDRKNPRHMRKFIVFEDNLLSLFQVCPSCQGSSTASVTTVGTMATVKQECSCGNVRKWDSQPMTGVLPAGNILLSASILYAGCNISKVFRMFQFLNLVSMCMDSFWRHQKTVPWPAIDYVWKTFSQGIFSEIRHRGALVTVSGDGRSDSVGHCAKYGTYSLVDMESGKVVSLHLVQVQLTEYVHTV